MMKQLIQALFVCCVFASCATYKEYEKYNANQTHNFQSKVLDHRFVLLGNMANGQPNDTEKILSQVKNQINSDGEQEKTTVLLLGNQVGNNSALRQEGSTQVEARLKPMVQSIKNSELNTIFIPGSSDWSLAGIDGLIAQQEYIIKELGKNHFYPKQGCPLKKKKISDDIELIIVDADWYIRDWDKHPTINENCTITSRKFFLRELSDYIRQNRGKTTLIAISRPIFSNGEHGGNYSAKSHLTPLPIAGNIKNIVRKTSGFSQEDLSSKYYNSLRIRLISLSQQNGKVVFLSGHENNLQYLVEQNIPQIISGSTTAISPVKNSKNIRYAHAEKGYAVLNVFTDGSSNVAFYPLGSSKANYVGDVLRKNPTVETDFEKVELDSIGASIYTKKEAHKGGFYRFFVGDRYRKLYGADITAPVVYLDTLKGGMNLSGIGGGHQTESLHFHDSLGQHFAFRGMKKRAAQYIQTVTLRDFYMQDQLESTLATKLLQDFFTGSYPYSALLTENLIQPVNLPTKHTEIVYLPKQETIGKFNEQTGNKLYTLEYPDTYVNFKPSGQEYKGEVFEGEDYSTYKMLERIQKNNNHRVDQKAYVRSRLFDMLIGDWDRHQDQWKWLEYKENGEHIYRPFPRDRDQAFSILGDGFLAKFAYILAPKSRLVENYSGEMKAIRRITKEPFPLDVAFLSELTLDDWLEEVNYIQGQLNDEVIDDAFENMIPEAKDENLAEIKKSLLSRREQLPDIAKKYYRMVAQYAKVTGTNKAEHFKIETIDHKTLRISISETGETSEPSFDRTFNAKDTKQVWIYGLGEEDEFEIIGNRSKIRIIIVGGLGKDNYKNLANHNVRFYDLKDEQEGYNSFVGKGKKHIRKDFNANNFRLEDAFDTYGLFLPIFGNNPDEGAKLGAHIEISKNKFAGTRTHKFKGEYYSATQGSIVNYTGSFPNVVGRFALNIDGQYNSANFTKNFFGYGNNTVDNNETLGFDYNRIYMTSMALTPSLSRSYFNGWNLSFGANYNEVELKDSLSGFANNNSEISNYLYEPNSFLGFKSNLSYNNKDFEAFPTNAFSLDLDFLYNKNLTQKNDGYFQLKPQLGADIKPFDDLNLILASKLRGDFVFGDDYEFFQAATIGNEYGLRGFRNHRFSGNSALSNSTDLRYVFNRFRTFLIPMRLGVYAGGDVGRVWTENNNSDEWHNSTGGGFILVIADDLSLDYNLFKTSTGFKRSFFQMGFRF